MKRSTLCFILLFLFLYITPFTFAQKDWVKISESQWQSNFTDVFFVDDMRGWIVGSNSAILNTTDGGKTWQPQPNRPLPFKVEFNKIHFINPKIGWIVGENGTVLKSTDGGNSWSKLVTETRVALSGVSFVDEKNGWACGDGGFVMHTNNGGISWEQQAIETNNQVESVHFVNPKVGWAAGGGGTILHTTDGGQNWGFQTSATVNTLDAISMLNDKIGWSVGAGGAVVSTVDGKNWQVQKSNVPQSNGMPEPIYDVHFANPSFGLAAAHFGVILRTNDGGITWSPIQTTAGRHPDSKVSHMISATEAWIVGC